MITPLRTPSVAFWIWRIFPARGRAQDCAIALARRVRHWQRAMLTRRVQSHRNTRAALRLICGYIRDQNQKIHAAGFKDLDELLAEAGRLQNEARQTQIELDAGRPTDSVTLP